MFSIVHNSESVRHVDRLIVPRPPIIYAAGTLCLLYARPSVRACHPFEGILRRTSLDF